MDRYHADQTNKQIFHMREYLKPVEAVFGLPKEQQDWLRCWCFRALPFISERSLREKSITHHNKTFHKRRDTSAAAANRRRSQLLRQGKLTVNKYDSGKKTLSQKLKARAAAKRDMN